MRLYDHLFTQADPDADGDFIDHVNPESLSTLERCMLEPSLVGARPGEPVQFERQGYFCLDADSTSERPVFNHTVGLRDTWAKVKAKGGEQM